MSNKALVFLDHVLLETILRPIEWSIIVEQIQTLNDHDPLLQDLFSLLKSPLNNDQSFTLKSFFSRLNQFLKSSKSRENFTDMKFYRPPLISTDRIDLLIYFIAQLIEYC